MIELHQGSLSLEHETLINILANQEDILIIQDLDGVCMSLVKDPLTRKIERQYLQATKNFEDCFFVLTNGEHIGRRGVNRIVEKAFDDREIVKQKGLYLPGLAGGGVQWQNRYGKVSHPGVSDAEMAFLEAVPQKMAVSLREFLRQHKDAIDLDKLDNYIHASILDNKVSPTVNLNVLHEVITDSSVYVQLQQAVKELTENLIREATQKGLDNSFFIHFAPNLGRDDSGREIMQVATESDSGTTDFQFMLRGAIKEAGVPFILNHYYYLQTGKHPLGKEFNSRQAPQNKADLITLIKENFDPQIMPRIIGVGDTVTSKAEENGSQVIFRRGGSDRGFLELIQALGAEFDSKNLVVYVDSSGGELKNRKPLKLNEQKSAVVESIGDVRDNEDPLTLNIVFPGGYRQYTRVFQEAANKRV